MSERTNCIERAGHVFILITRLQGRLVDFIIFNKHPRSLKYFIKNNSSPTLGKKRKEYRQKPFKFITNEFSKSFPDLPSNRIPLLEDLNNKRDIIAHGYISLYRDFILYQPDLSRADIKKKLKGIRRSIDGKITKNNMFKLRFDDKNYQDMIDGILEFDKKLFPSLAKKMRFNYNSIR